MFVLSCAIKEKRKSNFLSAQSLSFNDCSLIFTSKKTELSFKRKNPKVGGYLFAIRQSSRGRAWGWPCPAAGGAAGVPGGC